MPSPIAAQPNTDSWPKVRVFGVTYPFPTEAAARRFHAAHRHRGAELVEG